MAGLASPAGAATFTYATSGINNPDHLIDFSGLPDGTTIGATYAAQGANFLGLQSLSDVTTWQAPATWPSAVNFDENSVTTKSFEIDFVNPVTALSFVLVPDIDHVTISISTFLGLTPVEALIVSDYVWVENNVFFGFTDTLFDKVVFSVSGDQLGVLLDDVAFKSQQSVVPLPAALPLLVSGLGLLGLVARRRRQVQSVTSKS